MNHELVFLTVLHASGGLKPRPEKPVYSPSLETKLRHELFMGYEVLQNPRENVKIFIRLTILTVNNLNIKDQELSISGYLSVVWQDSRLDWSNSSTTSEDFTNVRFLFTTEEYVWRPALIIENSVKDIGIINDKSIPMRIVSDGTIVWNPSGIYEVNCESDITYYPLDTQECTVKISSWAYTTSDVSLDFEANPVDLSFFSANGEWDLVSASSSRSRLKSRRGISFSSLTYSLKLQRRPMFHVINTLFPVALMAILIAMVYKLPAKSGQKIGFSLTVLLAYAVYLTMISDNIPSTSVNICYLSIYLVLILTFGAASVVLTIFVLSVHFKSQEDEMSKWVKNTTKKCLFKIAGMQSCCTCSRNQNTTKVKVLNQSTIAKMANKCNPPVVEAVRMMDNKLTWEKLSKIMDKVFFNINIAMIVIVTVLMFLAIFVNYFTS
ncbi:neuronal acetylcholine receptor subunit alpha-6-like [Mytilus californianus]|uniref:neuronal acetylcholine receptor subunit alpha-6-like n=1 Tax=Mytilus californianus TaxID=6549 RepID=UPI002245716A|nr:neuronal acetylcholine receptor subunit alpha-6-like [Mytilus californianus]